MMDSLFELFLRISEHFEFFLYEVSKQSYGTFVFWPESVFFEELGKTLKCQKGELNVKILENKLHFMHIITPLLYA